MSEARNDEVLISHHGDISFVCFNRPDRNNTLTISVLRKLEEIANDFTEDVKTKVVIFHAKGKNFSFGADLDDIKSEIAKGLPLVLRRRQMTRGASLLQAIRNIPQVTICAMQGVVIGGAAAIASACDFRIGAEDCKVSYAEVKLGMPLMWQAMPLCVALIGPARAKKMIMSGQSEAAKTLLQWGFLDEVSFPDQLLDTANKMAQVYTKLPPIAVQSIKKSINSFSGALDQAIMHMDADQFLLLQNSDDAKEALAAIKEKRSGKYTGN